jgi:hypothetical protein
MKCGVCGATNPVGMKFCGSCGKPLPAVTAEAVGSRSRNCVQCGRSIDWDVEICMYCGYNHSMPKFKKGTEGHLITGAILTILASIMGLVLLMLIASEGDYDSMPQSALLALSFSCCVVGLFGGVAALMQRWFPVAVLGAAAAVFSPAFFFAVPGLILIANSAARFKDFPISK